LPNVSELDPSLSPLHTFGAELRRHRLIRGMTLDQLGTNLCCTGSLVGQIETAKRIPQLTFAHGADKALGTDGILGRMMPLVLHSLLPSWFLPYADMEAEASHIWSFEAQVVDGLLQTEEYATALLSRRFGHATEEKVMSRIERQRIFQREDPPAFWVVMSEAVLLAEIGGKAVMRRQLAHLLALQDDPGINFQILPFSVGVHPGLGGAFKMLRFTKNHDDLLYLEAYEQARMTVDAKRVKQQSLRYDHLQAAALSPRDSAELIKCVMEDRYGAHR
jgi:transcriptional regulator with XRE-family HTH domain